MKNSIDGTNPRFETVEFKNLCPTSRKRPEIVPSRSLDRRPPLPLPRFKHPNCSDLFYSFFVAVKYLREVTPYFRKASIIQEVGWELQRGFLSATPPPPKSPPRADTRYLPLQLCRLTRAHPSSDPGKLFHRLYRYPFNSWGGGDRTSPG